MKVKQLLLLFWAITWLCTSCGEKEDCCDNVPTDYDYTKGVFVVNEGPFGGTGTISWYNPETGEVRDSLFERANNGAELGQFVQSLTFANGKGYIVVNGANRVVIVDAATFQYEDTIGGLALPRYILPFDDKFAYITQWGNDGLTGSVAKIDLKTNKVLKTIPTGRGPEKMLRKDNLVYVANAGGYGVDSSITVINRYDDFSNQWAIPKGKNPATLAYDQDSPVERLFFLCKGYYLDTPPQGFLDFVGSTAPATATPAYADDLVRDKNTGKLYFIGGNTVFEATPTSNGLNTSALFAQNAYGLGYDETAKLLYCADAKDFSSPGEVVIYNTDGAKQGAFRAGVAPGEVLIVK